MNGYRGSLTLRVQGIGRPSNFGNPGEVQCFSCPGYGKSSGYRDLGPPCPLSNLPRLTEREVLCASCRSKETDHVNGKSPLFLARRVSLEPQSREPLSIPHLSNTLPNFPRTTCKITLYSWTPYYSLIECAASPRAGAVARQPQMKSRRRNPLLQQINLQSTQMKKRTMNLYEEVE